MNSAEIRESFLTYFESKGCRRQPSSSLIPEDPSLLLTTAGMVQFKPVFLGVKDLGFTRATTVQKCVRTTDIDIIGTTGRHHSFFEMLGNFSFGDYFKSEACAWAYEYSTQVLGLDPDRLWFSIFEDDDESEAIWRDEVGVPADRIVRMGEKDNFWAAGPTGPCGPCSELYYDQGPDVGCGSAECAPGCDCDRFLEYWNLVFMQYNRDEAGELTPLPKQNIDTGMGLERLAAILQGVTSNFETDILRTIMSLAEQITGRTYGSDDRTDTSLRIVADHARAVTFMIADGILPSNEGRGYVLRRILRRAVRHGRLLGVSEPFLTALTDCVVTLMGEAYPEIVEHHELTTRIVRSEEERFGTTLRQGTVYLDEEIARLRAEGTTVIDGETAFTLHDTFGFPLELTAEITSEAGMTVDVTTFERHMDAQRDRGRSGVQDVSWSAYSGAWSDIAKMQDHSEFLGYSKDSCETRVVAIVSEGGLLESIKAPAHVDVVLAQTPFYAEQGGQVGDTGEFFAQGLKAEVTATHSPQYGVIAHTVEVSEGELRVGENLTAAIDVPRRERIRRNHTATHILHWALRLVLGEHAKQAGSHVAADRLRFDFAHFEQPAPEQLEKIERLVNAKIMENHPVRNYETSFRAAREMGVTALFGEKYGDMVRVLEVGNFSKELCGGTHIGRTTEIGFLRIVSEGSVGANLRRIEAVTSFDALEVARAEEAVLKAAAEALKVRPHEVAEKVVALQKRLKESEKALAAAKREVGTRTDVPRYAASGFTVFLGRVDDTSADDLRALSDNLRASGGAVATVLAGAFEGRPLLLAAATDAAVAAGFDAGAIIKAMAPLVGGGGGGRPQMAQAGGKDISGIDAALSQAASSLGVG